MPLKENFILFSQKIADAVYTPSAETLRSRLGHAVWSDHAKVIQYLLASGLKHDTKIKLTRTEPLGGYVAYNRVFFEGPALRASLRFGRPKASIALLSSLKP